MSVVGQCIDQENITEMDGVDEKSQKVQAGFRQGSPERDRAARSSSSGTF